MNQIIVDTNAYSAFKRGNPEAVEIMGLASEIKLPIVVIGELYAGFAQGNREQRNITELQDFLALSWVGVLASDLETARVYGQLNQFLRALGRPIPSNDIWIAALALQHQLPLFSFDAHFSHFPTIAMIASLEDMF
jgi:tRNA(fMet)-specific endonuclease VapC